MELTLDTPALMSVNVRPPPVMVRGEGSWLWDRDGRRYLDFVQGWAVNCLGHCPGAVQRALLEQSAQLINASPAFHTLPAVELARALTARAGLERAFFCSSGAEANEGAVKLARKWGQLHRAGASEIVTTHGSFHGRTLAMMAASGKPGFATRFPPAVPGFVKVPYGDVGAALRALSERTVAVMVEPVQGEGGVVVPPDGYLRELRELTRARSVLLIADEIQTGMGRTGTLFACEAESVQPDIMTLGKGLGGGLPIGALLARAHVSCFAPGDQGGTFSGHPVLCAVAAAVLDALTAPGFLEHVLVAGEALRGGLRRIGARHGCNVRGRGLLCALELPAERGPALVEAALARELLINSPQPSLLRLMPALNVSFDEIDEMLRRMEQALDEVLARPE
jgi:acetylornithine/N-succinyldiaminopimelate aminotransferase